MQTHSTLGPHKTNAVITGILYISAAVTAIIALALYQPVLLHPDTFAVETGLTRQILTGALVDLLVVVSVAGTAIMLFPYIRRYREFVGLAYLCFRWLEAILILTGLLAVLAMVSLGTEFSQNATVNPGGFQMIAATLKSIHDWTFILGPNFMLGINTFIYSTVFYRSKLLPRKLAIFGQISAVLIFIAALLEIFGVMQQVSVTGMLFAFPVFLYEMMLAVRLISKGFNTDSYILSQA